MRVLFVLFLLFGPVMASAQGAATLVADNVTLNGEDQLIASGNVEVLFDGSRLTASQITYDQPSDTLRVVGPIVIQASDGTILTASSATLDPRLENGILQSARIVLDQQLQLAANQIDQRDGRFSQLYKTTATSCRVCGTGPPLWDIRAERVVYDAQDQQIYFRNATFRVRGVPVLWLPYMRLPDPALERSTGLLFPEQRNTTQLGFGLKLPYFITLGDHRDLTVTPYVSPETTTLELRYRQAFTNGRITAEGAVSDDTLVAGDRSYLFADGRFELRDSYQLIFDIETVSDKAYLLDYGYADKDRLDSAIQLLRVNDTALYNARLTYYQTLRDDETNASLPPFIADVAYEDSFAPVFGGLIHYGTSFDMAYRTSNTDGDTGRDVSRLGAKGDWSDSRVLPYGIIADTQIGLRADLYVVNDDTAFAQEDLRVAPSTGVTLRWPLARVGSNGTSHLLEPVISLTWSKSFGGTHPNEDGLRTELDRANLTAVSRFAGEDRIETGAQAAAGLTWTRFGAGGVTSTLSFGRVIRQETQDGFTATSGLNGQQSDWLVAAQVTAPGGFLIDARSLWDDNDGLTVADSRVAWQNDRVALGANYVWLSPDAGEDRDSTISEWTVDAAFVLNDAWTFEIDGRYDVAADEPSRAGVGLQWQNECVTVNVSASRRFTSSSTVDATTTFGITGSIGSFASGQTAGSPATGCGN
ncbi:LPS-assembly protein LptD [Roseobacter sp. CCS2]|uniref:LPS-assembly protein LptD n=1 Tax=Roseobacter sp. CCS2 TaxID=391593 RepID=UPI0000F3E55C|nr:LPS assembly protein LptD [Roseobacter sp. CCS2]EBA11083.1 organic solvent tolerance protein, putative [Roseobacter sp. CCS2]